MGLFERLVTEEPMRTPSDIDNPKARICIIE